MMIWLLAIFLIGWTLDKHMSRTMTYVRIMEKHSNPNLIQVVYVKRHKGQKMPISAHFNLCKMHLCNLKCTLFESNSALWPGCDTTMATKLHYWPRANTMRNMYLNTNKMGSARRRSADFWLEVGRTPRRQITIWRSKQAVRSRSCCRGRFMLKLIF
jgi:hypothetical protein